jgi:hypothetical protein
MTSFRRHSKRLYISSIIRCELRFYEDLFGVEFEEILMPGQEHMHFGEYRLLHSDDSSIPPLVDSVKLKQIKKERITLAIAKGGSDSWIRNPSKKLIAYRRKMVDIMIEKYG